MPAAKTLLQNPSINPRDSNGQPSNQGALAKNPLVLHSTAAPAIRSLPCQTGTTGWGSAATFAVSLTSKPWTGGGTHQSDDDEKRMDYQGNDQSKCDALVESIIVKPDSQQIGSKPGPTGDDVADQYQN